MSEILTGMEGVVCMMDDILVHGRTKEEHDKILMETLHRLQEAEITLNTGKCQFLQTSVTFLGHLIDGEGVRSNQEKSQPLEILLHLATLLPTFRAF